ncbi:hypothetical protein CAEBREN_00686 [Caenorhabditis brenneri]|uniref:Uncharacterized protein n=1 Tax=Caenorhabditis brenneri TaxID=135651 RepID=G0NIL3_CAEBE|nr:hypothetical protein CAEBREN_00686 [Caenorhabditis brenneri]
MFYQFFQTRFYRSTKRAFELAASSENGSTSETKKKKMTAPGTEESDDFDLPPNFEVKPFRGDLRAAEPLNRTEADEDIKVDPLNLQQLLVPKLEEEVETIPPLPQQLLVPKQEEEEDGNTQQTLNPPLLVPKEEVEEEDIW